MKKLNSQMITLILFTTLLTSPSSQLYPTIHDVLVSNGLPAGLLPQEVDSYSLYDDGRLEVYLDAPCLAKFETRVMFKYTDSVVRANLSYGSLTGVEGLTQADLFMWLPVKDITVENPNIGVITIDIGYALKQLSRSVFEEPPKCTPQGDVTKLMKRDGGFEALKMKGQEEGWKRMFF
ncbi:unnamed protein product [Microthlaspi erraticum]|uniref:DUF538 domain-containing protein n=1 Tax=Microthlaspi erraticum TaxID=1685480 RepID=A0A6D2KNV1_9BRAS|nr:unnamed protein product [Microthlaspi erraticum]